MVCMDVGRPIKLVGVDGYCCVCHLLGVRACVGVTDQVLGDLCQVRYTTVFGSLLGNCLTLFFHPFIFYISISSHILSQWFLPFILSSYFFLLLFFFLIFYIYYVLSSIFIIITHITYLFSLI